MPVVKTVCGPVRPLNSLGGKRATDREEGELWQLPYSKYCQAGPLLTLQLEQTHLADSLQGAADSSEDTGTQTPLAKL